MKHNGLNPSSTISWGLLANWVVMGFDGDLSNLHLLIGFCLKCTRLDRANKWHVWYIFLKKHLPNQGIDII